MFLALAKYLKFTKSDFKPYCLPIQDISVTGFSPFVDLLVAFT